MSFLRTCHNLHRGLRLLKRIAASREGSDLDQVIEDAVANADDLAGRIDALRRERKQELENLTTAVDAKFKKYTREMNALHSRVEDMFEKLSAELLAKEEQHVQTITGTHQAAMSSLNATTQSLNDLSEQVKAIREYAARQQEQVRRLQEGYDWALLKEFCLRIIRAIDDIDERLGRTDSEEARQVLDSVRDELVFSLEASGVEPYSPPVGSEYKGHEKTAEVVGKQPAAAAEQAGHIARVIRPGYQVFVSKEVTRIVRPAKVEVFAAP